MLTLNNQEIIKSVILSKLGVFKNRMYARKCIAKEISKKEFTDFCDKHHVQGGNSLAKVCFGLYYEDELARALAEDGSESELESVHMHTNSNILAENKKKQKLFNDERDKTGVKPNLDIPGSFRSMANTSNNIVYDVKKKSFAKEISEMLKINQKRLLKDLQELSKIGKTAEESEEEEHIHKIAENVLF